MCSIDKIKEAVVGITDVSKLLSILSLCYCKDDIEKLQSHLPNYNNCVIVNEHDSGEIKMTVGEETYEIVFINDSLGFLRYPITKVSDYIWLFQ